MAQRGRVEKQFVAAQLQRTSISDMAETVIKGLNPFDNFLLVLEKFPYDRELLWGASFWHLLVQPVPRCLWPEKPYLFNAEMMRQFKPISFRAGIGSTFSGLAELYVNLYWAGIIVGGALFGFLAKVLNAYYYKEKQNPGYLFWYKEIYMLPVSWLAVGFINTSKNINLVILTILSLLFLACVKEKRKFKT